MGLVHSLPTPQGRRTVARPRLPSLVAQAMCVLLEYGVVLLMIDDYAQILEEKNARIDALERRIGVLDLALRTAARRFNMMGGSFVNGIDPITAYHECLAALTPEEEK